MYYDEERYGDDRPATESEAHAEWHRNAGVPMGQPGCPQDACDPYYDEGEPCDVCGRYCDGNHPEEFTSRCAVCGEPCDGRGGGTAEMYDPNQPEEAGGIVHADCGLGKGWEIA